MAAAIKIRVGASVDRSVETTFSAFEARAKRAGLVVARNLNAGFRGGTLGPGASNRVAAGYDKEARAAEQAAKRQAKAAEMAAKAKLRAEQQANRAIEREAQRTARFMEQVERDRARSMWNIEARAQRIRAQEQRRESRRVEREAAQESRFTERRRERFARETMYGAGRNLYALGGMGRRFAGDMLRGAGIDFNIGGMTGRNVQLQRSAIALSNQGYDPNDPNKTRIDPAELMTGARQTGSKYGFNAAEIMAAHDAFTSLTGDLKQSVASMDDMAKLAAATGTNIEDMAQAQAEVSNALGKTDNKSAKIESIMRMIAGQGKVGAVEVKNMARGISAITSQAPQFEGDVGANIEKLSALAQIAKETGGARNAQEALIGVARFAGTFKTNARVNEFKAAGVNVYDKNKKIRDPYTLIKESLVATGGDPLKMGKLWMSVMGQRGVTGLTNAYNSAGGGQAGLKAVQEQLDKYGDKARMSKSLVDENAAKAASSDAAKAQRFQAKLDVIAEKTVSDLLPALEKLAPQVLKVSEAFSGLVTKMVDNPGTAIVLAITASIAQAAIGTGVRMTIERAIMAAFGGRGLGGGAGVGGTGAAGAAGAGAIAPVLATGAALAASELFYDQGDKLQRETGGKRNILSELPGYNLLPQFAQDWLPTITGTRMFDTVAATTQGLINPEGRKTLMNKGLVDAGGIGKLEAQLARVESVLTSIKGGTLQVRVTNAEDMRPAAAGAPPKVGPDGRSAPPGQR